MKRFLSSRLVDFILITLVFLILYGVSYLPNGYDILLGPESEIAQTIHNYITALWGILLTPICLLYIFITLSDMRYDA